MNVYSPLSGSVALVMGSATGIGAASAAGLARRGARVMLADVNVAKAEERAEEINAAGGEAAAITCDVGDEAQVEAAVRATVQEWGGIDILHNNAAAMQLVPTDGLVADADVDHWDETMRINLRGQMLGCKHAVPQMIARGGGSIINTSSVQGILGDVVMSAYGVAKAGVSQLTRTVATQNGRHNIRCNAVLPGLIVVDRGPGGGGLGPEKRAIILAHQLLPISGAVDDIANAVAFLAGNESRFVTGHIMVVDGGSSAHLPTYVDYQKLGS